MTLYQAVLLALVQGLTEFLPVSSSGHLLIARMLLHLPENNGQTFDAFLHLGTLGAVLIYYWRVWAGLVTGVGRRDEVGRSRRHFLVALIIATIPGALAGYLFQDQIEEFLRGPRILAVSFLISAFILWWFDRLPEPAEETAAERVSWRDALIIGLWQIVALVPAISRSGTTIAAGRARGMSRKQATNWSFLMSAPIIAGASMASLLKLIHTGAFSSELLLVGTFVSFASGLASIYFLIRLIQRVSFRPFAVYLVLVAAAVWLTTL